MKKVLFFDRDGTIIIEPPSGFQVDSLAKLQFVPGVIRNLARLSELEFEFVMVTNQDGLGTDSFPEDAFWPAHNMMLKVLEGEGVRFDDIVIDRTFPEDNAPTRKPGTALLGKYLDGSYDLSQSFVIGDRQSDVELAANLGSKAIFFGAENKVAEFSSTDWDKIYLYLVVQERSVRIDRVTSETAISVCLNVDGTGQGQIKTGLGFFDHMLEQLAKHSGCDIEIAATGDLLVDEHHLIEDTALALGDAFNQALFSKRGLERYGYALPMDDCAAQVLLDFSGRSWLVWETEFRREMIGKMPTEMFQHFFKSFCDAARCNLNIKAQGQNEHHKIESIFKAWGRAIKMAVRRDLNNMQLPTTKGTL